MGYYKELNIELQQHAFENHFESAWENKSEAPAYPYSEALLAAKLESRMEEKQTADYAEKAALAYLQPCLSKEFSEFPEADSLLDFVKAFSRRKAKFSKQTLESLANWDSHALPHAMTATNAR